MCPSSCKSCEINQKQKKVKRDVQRKRILRGIAILGLIVAFILGNRAKKVDYHTILQNLEPKLSYNKIDEKTFSVYSSDSLQGYAIFNKEKGYGGPLEIALLVDTSHKIKSIHVINHTETASFFNRLQNNDFFKQFAGINISNQFALNEDVEAVSGATVSSAAFSKAIRTGSYKIGNTYFGYNLRAPSTLNFGQSEWILISIFVLAIISSYLSSPKLTISLNIISLIFLGFYLNISLSITQFGALFLGFIPSLESNINWWLLVGLTLGFLIFSGKNIYCFKVCPFYTIQWLLNKFSGINFRISKTVKKYMYWGADFLLWVALCSAFISRNPAIGSFEPFATMFSFRGEGFQWLILPLVLIGSLFVKDLFCRYYCPVGRLLTNMIKRRKKLIQIISKRI